MPESLADGGLTRDTETPAPAPPVAALSAFEELLPVEGAASAFTSGAIEPPEVLAVEPLELVPVPLDVLAPLLEDVDITAGEDSAPEELVLNGDPLDEPLLDEDGVPLDDPLDVPN